MTITVIFDPPQPGDSIPVWSAKAADLGNKLNPWAGQVNDIAVQINTDKDVVVDKTAQTLQAATDAMVAASVSAAINAPDWVPGATYEKNKIVWGAPDTGTLYRCILAHSGSSVPPEQDLVHWVVRGERITPLPTGGMSSASYQWRPDGKLASCDFIQDGIAGAIAYTYDEQGRMASATTVFDGVTLTETLTWSGSQIASVSAVETLTP